MTTCPTHLTQSGDKPPHSSNRSEKTSPKVTTVTLKLPSPVRIGPPSAEGEPDPRPAYSLTDMVRHFLRRAPAYNANMEGARQGQRTLEALCSPDADEKVTLLLDDCRVLNSLVENPGPCGWIDARAPQTVMVSLPNGKTEPRSVLRRVDIPAATFIPLADAVPSVPPSP